MNRKIAQLQSRITNNCTMQEGEPPVEDPAALLQELDSCCGRLQYLMARINITNCAATIEGRSVTELIAEKDMLLKKIQILQSVVNTASNISSRARHTEIKVLSAVDVVAIQKQVDETAKRIRLLDNQLQSTNWTVDLME